MPNQWQATTLGDNAGHSSEAGAQARHVRTARALESKNRNPEIYGMFGMKMFKLMESHINKYKTRAVLEVKSPYIRVFLFYL
jgi:hypothetical protein